MWKMWKKKKTRKKRVNQTAKDAPKFSTAAVHHNYLYFPSNTIFAHFRENSSIFFNIFFFWLPPKKSYIHNLHTLAQARVADDVGQPACRRSHDQTLSISRDESWNMEKLKKRKTEMAKKKDIYRLSCGHVTGLGY